MYLVLYTFTASKKKKAEEKKRKHHPTEPAPGEKKRPKLDSHHYGDPGLSDQDKSTLDRWKRIQQTTKPFVHPIRKLVAKGGHGEGGALVYIQQQEQLLRQQSDHLEQQGKQLAEQQGTIRVQQECIRKLQEQKTTLIRECQAAGIKLPASAVEEVSTCTNRNPIDSHQNQPLPAQPCTTTPYDNPRVVASRLPPPPSQGPAQPPISPAQLLPQPPIYTTISRPNRTPPPPQLDSQSLPSAYQAALPHGSIHAQQIAPHPQGPWVSGTSPVNPTSLPATLYPSTEGDRTNTLIASVAFSPLMSSELQPTEPQNLPVYSPDQVNTYNPFTEDLDSILNIEGLPTGSGAGYGVGVWEEDLPARAAHPTLDLR